MDAHLHITAGDGPKECQWVVVKLAAEICKTAKSQDLQCEILSEDDIGSATQSLLLKISGKGSKQFANSYVGTIRWIGQSPFRKNHKRKNWFVGVSIPPALENIPDFNEKHIRYQTMKASGPGGQHVNKTESAVRATYIPTGTTVTASEERSQFANKRLARMKLAMGILIEREQSASQTKQTLWAKHKTLERGNEVRAYEGSRFKRKV